MEELIEKLKKTPPGVLIVIVLLSILIISQFANIGNKKQKQKAEEFTFQIEKKENIYQILNSLKRKLEKTEMELNELKKITKNLKEQKLNLYENIVNTSIINPLVAKSLNNLIKKHGNVVDQHILEDGSIIVTTADGKKFKINPDGTIEELKDYYVDKNGNIILEKLNGKKEKIFFNNKDKILNELTKKHKGIVSKKILPDGSIIVKTKDGKIFKISPDGKISELINYYEKDDGTISFNPIKIITKPLSMKELIINKLKDINGNIKNFIILNNDSLFILFENGNAFIIDNTEHNLIDYYINDNSLYYQTYQEKNNIKFNRKYYMIEYLKKNNGNIKDFHITKDNEYILKFSNGKKYIVLTNSEYNKLKDYEVNYLKKVITYYLIGKKITFNNLFKNLKILDKNKIYKIVDENGNIYIKDKDGNWYKITPEGKKIKIKGNIDIDKNGNILINGKKVGKTISIEKKDNILTDKNGNIYFKEKIGNDSVKAKILEKSDLFKKIIKKHGKIKNRHILADGSIIVTTADGKNFKINPDGTIEKLEDYKINPDGSITYITKDGKIESSKLAKSDKTLNNLIKKHGNVVDQHVLEDGSVIVTTTDGKKFKINPDGTIEKLEDYKVNPDGTITYITKDGNKFNKKENKISNKLKKLEKFYGKIKNRHILADGSIIVTTTDGKKFKINPDGTIEKLEDYKINPDGSITYITKDGKVESSKLAKSDKTLNNLIKKHGNVVDQHVLEDGSVIVTTTDGKKFKINPDGTIEKLEDYKVNPDGTITYTTKGKKYKKKLSYKDKILNDLIKKHGNVVDQHVLEDGSVIVTTADGKKFKINPDGTIEELEDYKVNPDGTITYITKGGKIHKTQISKSEQELNKLKNKHGNVVDQHVLEDGSVIVTTADGKKFKINPDGTIEELENYRVNPDGTIDYINKNKKIINKIFKDKDGNYYLLTSDGKKIYPKKIWKDKYNRMHYIDLAGKEHVLKNLKDAIIKQNVNNEIRAVGEGNIIITNNDKKLVINKIYKIKFGKPLVSFVYKNKDFYEEIENKIYKNNKFYFKGRIYLNNNVINIVNHKNKIINSFNVSNTSDITYKDFYFYSKNLNRMIIIRPNKFILFNFKDKTIIQKNYVNWKKEKDKIIINMKYDKLIFNTSKIKGFPIIYTNNRNYFVIYNNYFYLFNKKYFPLIFVFFKENNYFDLLGNRIIFRSNGNKRYIDTILNTNIGYLYLDSSIFFNNMLLKEGIIYKNKNLKENLIKREIKVYEGLNYLLVPVYNSLLIGNEKKYVISPQIEYLIVNNNLFVKSLLQQKSIGKYLDIQKSYLIDKNILVAQTINSNVFLINKFNIENIGKGDIVIKNDKIYIKNNKGIYLLGTLKKENNKLIIDNGIIKKNIINQKTIKEINNFYKNFSLLNLRQEIEMLNGDRYFYNDKGEVIKISSLRGVERYPNSKIFFNTTNKTAYLYTNGIFKKLGKFIKINIKNTAYKTTKGLFYIFNNNIYKITKNHLVDLKLYPFILNGHLLGLDLKNNKKYDLGLIIYTLIGKPLKIKIEDQHLLNIKPIKNEEERYKIVNENGKIKIIDNKTGKEVKIIKQGNKIILKDSEGNIINNDKLKVKYYKGKFYINGKSYDENQVLFSENYLYKTNNKIKMLSNKEVNKIFNLPKLKINKPVFIKPNNKESFRHLSQTETKGRLRIYISKNAKRKNYLLFIKKNKSKSNIYIGLNGEIEKQENQNEYFVPIGTKFKVTLMGGAIAPLMLGVEGGIDKGLKTFLDQINIALFRVEDNIMLKDGTLIPLKNAIITATPVATTLQRIVFNVKSITFYDETKEKWFYSDKVKGSIYYIRDKVPGFPAVLIDYRDKYLAKSTIYSVLNGITNFLVASKSPIASASMMSNMNNQQTNTGLGNAVGQSVITGTQEQLKNINQLLLAIIKAQIPYLVCKNNEKGIFVVTDNFIIKGIK